MRILNFGSLNIDYVYLVEHFVRPGETIQSMRHDTYCGGKGLNQSIALARAGAKVYHAGKIGKDGQVLLECLKTDKVDTRYIKFAACRSGHAIIQVDGSGQNCIMLFGGANQEITEYDADFVISEFGRDDILLLQNEINCVRHIMEKAHDKGMRIALNPSPMDYKIKEYPMEYVNWFILNSIEGLELTGEEEPERICRKMIEKYPYSSVVLTLGKKGVLYKDSNSAYSHGVYNVPVIDTTAAGDTFTGYFIACVAEGLSTEKSLEVASIASSLAVSRKGASDSIPKRKEVYESTLQPE